MNTSNRRETLAAWGALLMLIPAVVVINLQVYWVRILFINAHPEDAVAKPPTISGAIADPAIGIPFARWMTAMSPALAIGTCLVIYLMIRDCRRRTGVCGAGMQVLCSALVAVQIVSCVGILLLSWNRFPDGRDLHMLGSYIFFGAQFLVMVLWALWCRAMLRKTQGGRGLIYAESDWIRLRRLAPVAAALYPIYLCLFVGKDLVPQAIWPVVIQVYVWMELAVISATLLYCLPLVLPALRLLRRA